jgi:hypothetical protein
MGPRAWSGSFASRARHAAEELFCREAQGQERNLVHCEGEINCWLAERLLSSGHFIKHYPLLFQNPASTEATRTLNTKIVLKGQHSGKVVTEEGKSLELSDEQDFPTNEITRLPLTVDRTAMYPDHYIGAVHLTMEAGLERLTVPIDLSVRAGPIWVIPALLTGIVLGQVVRVVEESKANTTSPITGNWREQIKGRLKRLSEQVFGKEFDFLQLFIKLALLLGPLAVGVETL